MRRPTRRRVESPGDEIHEAIGVRSVHLEIRMTPCELREHRRDVRRAEGKRRGHAQQAAHLALGGEAVAGSLHFRRDARRVLAESRAGLGERGTAGRARQELRAELPLEARQAPAHDRFGQPETSRGWRDAAGFGHGHEGLQIGQIRHGVPVYATQNDKLGG